MAFLIAHQVGLHTIAPRSPLSPLWPPAGVLLASFMLLRRPLWPPAIAVVTLTTAFSLTLAGARFWVGLAYVIPSLIELAIALWALRKFAGPNVDFRRVRDTFALVGGAMAGATVSGAVAGGLAVVISGAPFVTSAVTWWSADVLGMLLLTPMIIAWV
ncbi:MAG: MASE1 domain-containing protein, partial [Burkholderiaceae bacterium]|nr:MASE1 domain-containing protein [Burkholderiaceae bacterium]